MSVVLCAAILSAALCTGVQAAGMKEFQKQRTYSGQFHDIEGKWYETYIADLYEYGLADGVGANAMAPEDSITVAQIVALAARVNAKYYDGRIGEADGGAWYAPYISYAIDYGLIAEKDSEDVDRPATRAESTLILSRALPGTQFEAVNEAVSFSDVAADDPCRKAVALLCRAGVITGYGDGTFRPERGISRAEAMTIVDRVVNKSLRKGYNEWLQNQPADGGTGGGSGDDQGREPIGVGVGFGRATFLLQGTAMLTVDMENSRFTLAVSAGETGGMVTVVGVCEVKTDNNGRILMSCVVSDRVAQGGADTETAEQAAALSALGFVYDGNRTLRLTEAISGGTPVTGEEAWVVGKLRLGATLTVAN